MTATEGIQKAGDVRIDQLKLITASNVVIDLIPFLVEINIYEDIFSMYMKGEILLTDSRNIIDKFNIHGEEFLNVKFRTPTFNDGDSIEKTFRVFKLSNREIVRDNNTQNFTLHFVSIEVFHDIMLPLFVPFEGNIVDVAGEIFTNYLATSRNYNVSEDGKEIKENIKGTGLLILNEAANQVKFVSPGWSPMRCINWLASKAIPKDEKCKNFLFFETNKNFYFGSIEALLKNAVEKNNLIGTYTIAASNMRDNPSTPNVDREMFLAKDVEMVQTVDYVRNYTNGYLSNRLVFLDIINKDYQLIDYDHVEEYSKLYHTSGTGKKAMPVFSNETVRNAATSISFYPKNPKLFDNFKDNINEKMNEIYGNRLSSMVDLTNIRMNVTVPGRTDIEAGRLLYFSYPSLGGKDQSDKSLVMEDKYYSGYYLITAIRHKITRDNNHTMSMEIIKDSLSVQADNVDRVT